MNNAYYAEETFNGTDFTLEYFETGDYENCQFINCRFTNTNLAECNLIDCKFVDCDLSNVNLAGLSIRNSEFNNCKMVGLLFHNCTKFGFSAIFKGCNLNFSSFSNLDVTRCAFDDCQLQDVDFTRSVLTGVVFDYCDFAKATFSSTTLLRADLRSSYNFVIDPERNQIRGALFSVQGLPGLLEKYNIIVG